MASKFGPLLEAVKNSVTNHADRQKHTGFDPSELLGHLSDLFGKHEQESSERDVHPASEDPYGDPADQSRAAAPKGKLKPAVEDPYGDPADESPKRA